MGRAKQLGKSGSGFLLALWMNHAAYGVDLGFPEINFGLEAASALEA